MYRDHAIDPTATGIYATGNGLVHIDLISVGGDVDRFEVPDDAAERMAHRILDAVTADRNMADRNWPRRRQLPERSTTT